MVTQVGIVDDHPTLVFGVSGILELQSDMALVASGASVPEVLAQNTHLDVVLLDLSLSDGSTPTENAFALAAEGIKAIAFTSGERPALIREASKAGVQGMVRKSEPPEVLLNAIRVAANDGVVASPDWAAALDSDSPFVTASLSPREAQVLALYASGETAERVAAQLFISRETVLDHIQRIRAKYAALSRPAKTKVDLYRRAVEDGIVAPQG